MTARRAAELQVARARRGRHVPSREARVALGFLLPFLGLFGVFFLVPVAYALWQSLHAVRRSGLGFGGGTVEFVGIDNYLRAATDPTFASSVLRVLLFGIVQVPVMIGMALVMALLFDSTVARFKRFFQFAAFAPYAVPGVIGAILWSFLYLPGISPIVEALRALRLPSDLLAPESVLWSMANITTWQWTGYNMLVLFAALQAVPREIYEAARVDGARGLHLAWCIKLPAVRPALVLTVVFSIIGTLQLFSEPAVLRALSANVTPTYTPNLAAYTAAFTSNDPHYAAALAVALAVATFILSFGFLKVTQRGMQP